MHQVTTKTAVRRGRVRKWWFAAAGGVVALAVAQSTFAAPNQLVITQVFVDSPVVDQMTINGQNFDGGSEPVVTLGDLSESLVIVNPVTATAIVVQLPAGLAVGDYLLTVSTGSGGSREDVYNLTIGAPETPIGVPTGAIVLWDQSNSCPAGFARVNSFDERFLVASATAGSTGGSNNHTHDAGTFTGPAHDHRLEDWDGVTSPVDDHSGGDNFSITTTSSSGGTMSGTSGSADSRPAFRTVLLCRRN